MANQQEYRQLLKYHAPEPRTLTMLEQLLKVSQRYSSNSIFAGNDARLLVDGPGTFKSMFDDIEHAQKSIDLETFIFENDNIGQELAQRLIASSKRGIRVRVLIDAIGSIGLPNTFIEQLAQHGIEIHKFHPIDPTEDVRIWRSNNRDHRKLLIIDDKIAYTGGINISGVYSKSSFSSMHSRHDKDKDQSWRDTQVRIVGPVVRQFKQHFIEMWNTDLPKEEHVDISHTPHNKEQGEMLVGVIASNGGDEQESDIYSTLAAAFGHAQKRVWITQAYFAPDKAFIEMIKTASERGVDVRLLLPRRTDATLLVLAARSNYEDLLNAGVRIFERKGSTLHAKTLVVDGVWSSIGSTNFDYRSFVHNFELNSVIVSRSFGNAMEKLYEVDLQQADEITLKQWQRRPVLQRLKESIGHFLRYWL